MSLDYLIHKRKVEIELLTGKTPHRKSQIDSLGIAVRMLLPISSVNTRLRVIKKFEQLMEIYKTNVNL